jgi:hypothetical protein
MARWGTVVQKEVARRASGVGRFEKTLIANSLNPPRLRSWDLHICLFPHFAAFDPGRCGSNSGKSVLRLSKPHLSIRCDNS